jgi:deoxyribonuclease II
MVSAVDDSGSPCDWWFAYKVPQLSKDAQTASATGYEYVYFDPKLKEPARSPHTMDSGGGALANTLVSVFKNPAASTGWILYNDEMPACVGTKDVSTLGHTKGVLAFDVSSESAFWLLHSWPKYADPSEAAMPTPMYGQTFLCISLSLTTVSAIAAQMIKHQQPQTYHCRIPGALAAEDPLCQLAKGVAADAPGDSDVLSFKSRGNLDFKVIAKNKKWGRDFWNDLVGPALGADIDVETWIRGKIPPTLDSDGIHKTFDVKYIDLSRIGAPWAWPETHDHAKWAITKGVPWICVGDINRMVSQENRGGGTIAFQNTVLWESLAKTDLIVAPPGHTRADALALIRKTHAR